MTIDKYLSLNARFPLEETIDSTQSLLAIKVLAELAARENELTIHEFAYFAALNALVEDYANNDPKPMQSVPGHEFLAHLLKENVISTYQLADETEIPRETIENYLAGNCELFGSQLKKLGEYFSLNPAVFLL